MKRLHLHISVRDLDAAKRFYSTLFAMDPTVEKSDYVKWMVDDPKINLAISKSGAANKGINHLGIQVDNEADLAVLEERLAKAEIASAPEQGANCCYARSDKHWTRDPDNVVWELFHTLESIPVYGEDSHLDHPVAKLEPARTCC